MLKRSMAMGEKQKTDGAFLEIFGNPVDNGYSPDVSFVEELLVALEDFRFGSSFGKMSKAEIERSRRAWESQKKCAFAILRKSPRICRTNPVLKESLVRRHFISVLITNKEWSEVWKKFRENCEANPRLISYIDRTLVHVV